jgi:hypothetical protein
LTARRKALCLSLVVCHVLAFCYLLWVDPSPHITPKFLRVGLGGFSKFVRNSEEPVAFVLWQGMAVWAAYLAMPHFTTIRLIFLATPAAIAMFILNRMNVAALVLAPLLPGYALFASMAAKEAQTLGQTHRWTSKDAAWLVLVLSAVTMLVISTLELFQVIFGARQSFNSRGAAEIPFVILVVIGSACVLAFALRYLPKRNHPDGDNFWAVVVGCLAITAVTIIVSIMVVTGISTYREFVKLGGWVIILFPVMLLALAIWAAGCILGIYVINKCLPIIKAAWDDKLNFGSLQPYVDKAIEIVPDRLRENFQANATAMNEVLETKPVNIPNVFGKRR